jgi:hypothetical protein
VYIADGSAAIRRVTPDGTVTTLAGIPDRPGRIDGLGAEARFSRITGIAAAADGTIYVSDGNFLRSVTPEGFVTTIAGKGTPNGNFVPDSYDNRPVSIKKARFEALGAVIVNAAGQLYVADGGSIRRVDLVFESAK